MLSGRMHWLTVGLALLVSAGWTLQAVHGQAPMKPSGMAGKKQSKVAPATYGTPYGMPGMPPGMGGMGVSPAGGMMGPDAPMSMAFPGPAPMDVMYASGCDGGCDSMGANCTCGGGGLFGGGNCSCGSGGLFGGGNGCGACGGGSGGALARILGPLAPYSEAGRGAQRWFDVYAGTIALARFTDVGGVSSGFRNQQTGEFLTSDVISGIGANPGSVPVLSVSDLDLDKLRYGLEIVGNIQTGVGSNVEVRYFGLNNWTSSLTARSTAIPPATPNLYSIFSLFGTVPPGGFDDTDRSLVHTIDYNSELHNGEVNFRRRWVSASDWTQGSFLFGIRYFDLDERFGFAAIGSNDNTFTFDQLRFFNYDVNTRNQLTGVQVGGDLWLNLMPGVQIGVEGKSGIYGNHAEVESLIVANSVPGVREFLQDGKTAFVGEITASAVYRVSYAFAIRGSYNFLYVDNVALAPENFNTRDFTNALGSNRTFTLNRFPFLNADGEVGYQGYSVGLEWTW